LSTPRASAWVRGWRGDLLAAAGGALLPWAFSPFFAWPLALVSVACLFAACLDATPRRAAFRGWSFGLLAFGVGVSWIVSSFQFAHIALPVAIVLTAGFVVFLGVFTAASAWAAARLRARLGPEVALLAVFPGTFVLGEWLRGWFLTGFTWLQLGYSQVDGPLAGVLPLGGVYAASLTVAVMAGALVMLAVRPGRRAALALLGVSAVSAALVLAGEREWTRPAGAALTVALVQGNVAQDQKWLQQMRGPTLERYMALTAPHLGADLVVWPETALPGRRRVMQPFIDRLDQLARDAGSAVLFGVPEWDGDPLRPYNSVLLAGSAAGRYRKRHLVPFGEYLPADTLLRPITRALGIPVSDFAGGGAAQAPLEAAGYRIATFICYEIAFGNEVIRALPEAALIVTVSNDAWFGNSLGPHQHLQMARARALETGRAVLRATNTGITALVDERGRVAGRLPQFEAGALGGQVTPRAGATPYVRVGDAPALVVSLLLACGAALLAGIGRRRR